MSGGDRKRPEKKREGVGSVFLLIISQEVANFSDFNNW